MYLRFAGALSVGLKGLVCLTRLASLAPQALQFLLKRIFTPRAAIRRENAPVIQGAHEIGQLLNT